MKISDKYSTNYDMIKKESKFLSTAERAALLVAHKKERDGKVKDRMKCIILLDKGWSYSQIAEALLLDDQTLRNYKALYDAENIEGLVSNHYTGRHAKLNASQMSSLERHLDEITYLTADQVKDYIKTTYNLNYTKKGVISLLHRLDFKYKKPKVVPGKPDIDKQKDFIEQYKEIKAALKETDEIIFLDGVPPCHNVSLGYGWIKKGAKKQISSNTGRARLNISGALDVRKTELLYREDDSINSDATMSLLIDILDKYPNAEKIHVILDNAPYNRSKKMHIFKNHL